MSNKMTKTLTAISTKTKVGVTVALAALGIAAATLPMNLFATAVKFTPTKQISETSYDLRATFDAKKIKNHKSYGFYLSNMFAKDCNALAKYKDTKLINSALSSSNVFTTGTNVTPETNYYACPWVKNSEGRVFAGHVVKFKTISNAPVIDVENSNFSSTYSSKYLDENEFNFARFSVSSLNASMVSSSIIFESIGTCYPNMIKIETFDDAISQSPFASFLNENGVVKYKIDTNIINLLSNRAATYKVIGKGSNCKEGDIIHLQISRLNGPANGDYSNIAYPVKLNPTEIMSDSGSTTTGLCPTYGYGAQLFKSPDYPDSPSQCLAWMATINPGSLLAEGGNEYSYKVQVVDLSHTALRDTSGAGVIFEVYKEGTTQILLTTKGVYNDVQREWTTSFKAPIEPGRYNTKITMFCDPESKYYETETGCKYVPGYGKWIEKKYFDVVAPTVTTTPTVGTLNTAWNAQSPSGLKQAAESQEIARLNLTAVGGDISVIGYLIGIGSDCSLEGQVLGVFDVSNPTQSNSVRIGSDRYNVKMDVGFPSIQAGTTKVVKFVTDTNKCVSTVSSTGNISMKVYKVFLSDGRIIDTNLEASNNITIENITYQAPIISTIDRSLTLSKNTSSPSGLKVPSITQNVLKFNVSATDKDVLINSFTIEAKQGGTCNLQNTKVVISNSLIDMQSDYASSANLADLSGTAVTMRQPLPILAGATKVLLVYADTTSCSMDSALQFSVKGVGVQDNTNVVINGLPVIGGAISY